MIRFLQAPGVRRDLPQQAPASRHRGRWGGINREQGPPRFAQMRPAAHEAKDGQRGTAASD